MGMSFAIGATPMRPRYRRRRLPRLMRCRGFPREGPRVVVGAADVARCHDLARARELLVVDVNACVDDRDRHLFATGERVSGGHVCACVDDLTADRCLGQVPLLREHPAAKLTNQLWMGVFDVLSV